MDDTVYFILALLGVVVGVILVAAQLQLFAIRRLLETLVKETRPQGVSEPSVAAG